MSSSPVAAAAASASSPPELPMHLYIVLSNNNQPAAPRDVRRRLLAHRRSQAAPPRAQSLSYWGIYSCAARQLHNKLSPGNPVCTSRARVNRENVLGDESLSLAARKECPHIVARPKSDRPVSREGEPSVKKANTRLHHRLQPLRPRLKARNLGKNSAGVAGAARRLRNSQSDRLLSSLYTLQSPTIRGALCVR